MTEGLLGIIGGTAFSESKLFSDAEKKNVETPYGQTEVETLKGTVFIQRHSPSMNIPPHMINYKAKVWAMKDAEVSGIIGVGSVGSLKRKIKPPCIIIPDDFIQTADIPTYFDYKRIHVTPFLDAELRRRIISAAKKAGVKNVAKGVYAQTRGPRLETKAEVRMLGQFADVVGMTLASEATLAREVSIPYAMLCTVDNYGNGIGKKELDFHDVANASKKNSVQIEKILGKLM